MGQVNGCLLQGGNQRLMGRSPVLEDLIQGVEDYAEKEGLEPYQAVMQLMEHFVPGIENDADAAILIFEDDTLH